jgi:hypothetical protein
VWLAFGELYVNEIEQRIFLREDETILYDWYVSHLQRGKSIGPKIWAHSIIYIKRRGYRRAYGLVASYNKVSNRALSKINSKAKTTIIFLKIFTLKRLLQTLNSMGLDLSECDEIVASNEQAHVEAESSAHNL